MRSLTPVEIISLYGLHLKCASMKDLTKINLLFEIRIKTTHSSTFMGDVCSKLLS